MEKTRRRGQRTMDPEVVDQEIVDSGKFPVIPKTELPCISEIGNISVPKTHPIQNDEANIRQLLITPENRVIELGDHTYVPPEGQRTVIMESDREDKFSFSSINELIEKKNLDTGPIYPIQYAVPFNSQTRSPWIPQIHHQNSLQVPTAGNTQYMGESVCALCTKKVNPTSSFIRIPCGHSYHISCANWIKDDTSHCLNCEKKLGNLYQII
jgi:hypothetical protein